MEPWELAPNSKIITNLDVAQSICDSLPCNDYLPLYE